LHAQASKWCTHVKTGYFTDIGSSNVKTVADKHRNAANHDLE